MLSNVSHTSLGRRIANADLGSILIGGALFVFIAAVFFSGIMPKSKTVQCAAIVAVDLVVVVRLIRKNRKIKLQPPGVIAILFLVFILVNQGDALVKGADGDWLLRFTLCFVAAILLMVDSVDWLSYIVKVIAVLALVHALATIAFFLFPNLYTGWFKPRFYPFVINATDYKSGLCEHYSSNGMYLAWGLIASFYFWQTLGRHGGKKWQVTMLLALIALLLTTKRAHLIFGMGCCLVIYLLLNAEKGSFGTTIKLISFLIVALMIFYIVSLYVPELAGVVDRLNDAELDDSRSSYYGICLSLFETSPIAGHGWESFTTALYQSGISDLARLYRNGNLHQNAHNVYLQLLAEEGLVGFSLFMGLAVSSVLLSIKKALSNAGSLFGGLCTLAVGVQMFFLLYCITGNPLYDVAEYSVYLLAGLALFLVRPSLADNV